MGFRWGPLAWAPHKSMGQGSNVAERQHLPCGPSMGQPSSSRVWNVNFNNGNSNDNDRDNNNAVRLVRGGV